MTPQEMFNKAYEGVLAQGRFSVKGKSSTCYYRYPGNPNIRCGVGHVMPDDIYKPFMDKHELGIGASTIRQFLPPYMIHNMALLEDLQYAHDEASNHSLDHFKMLMANVAKEHNLKVPGNA